MTVLVVGATGMLGGLITRRLLHDGRPVRALVRPGSAHEELASAGAALVFGDLKAPESLVEACRDTDVVITTATASHRGGEDTVETVDAEGNRALIDAARDAGVRQFIFTSAYQARPDAPVPLLRAKSDAEAYLRASGMPYTILRPVAFLDIWIGFIIGSQLRAGPTVRIVGNGTARWEFVGVGDVAELAARVVDDPAARNASLPFAGDAASFREVLARIEQALGAHLKVESVSPDAELPGLPPVVPMLWSMIEHEAQTMPAAGLETARAFGITPLTVAEYVRSTFGAPAPV